MLMNFKEQWNKGLSKAAFFLAVATSLTLVSCEPSEDPAPKDPDSEPKELKTISLTGDLAYSVKDFRVMKREEDY